MLFGRFKVFALLGGLTIASFFAGCQSINQKAHNTGQFIAGNTEEILPRPANEVADACRKSLDDSNLAYISTEEKPFEEKGIKQTQTIITARTHGDDKITFTITPQRKGTQLQVNSGVLGDTEMRHRLIDAVNKRLGAEPIDPTTPPSQPSQ